MPIGPAIPGIPTSPSAPSHERHEVKPLIDGLEVFNSVLADLIEARDRIYFALWAIDSDFFISRTGTATTGGGTTLINACARQLAANPRLEIYFLIWGTRLTGLGESDFDHLPTADNGRVHFEYETNLPFGSHHQKFILLDVDYTVFPTGRDAALHCMGLNLKNSYWGQVGHLIPVPFAGVTKAHHDTGIRVQGPIILDFEEEFRRRWVAAGGTPLPAGQFNRTPRGTTAARALIKPARQDNNALRAWYETSISAIDKFFYFDAQYFDDEHTTNLLIARFLRQESLGTPIRGAIVQTHIPDLGLGEEIIGIRVDTFLRLRELRIATARKIWIEGRVDPIERPAGGWGKVINIFECNPVSTMVYSYLAVIDGHTGKRYTLKNIKKVEGGIGVYRMVGKDRAHPYAFIHSKLAIIDGQYTIGSCNISEQSFTTDSEANVLVTGAGEVSDVIRAFWPALIQQGAAPTNIDQWLDAFEATADGNIARAANSLVPNGLLHHFPLKTFTK